MSSAGYWKRWELNTVWLAREIVWQLIQGNPDIKPESKPNSKEQLYKLSLDEPEIKSKQKEITPEELEMIRQRLLKRMK